jgi:hypothetical protein
MRPFNYFSKGCTDVLTGISKARENHRVGAERYAYYSQKSMKRLIMQTLMKVKSVLLSTTSTWTAVRRRLTTNRWTTTLPLNWRIDFKIIEAQIASRQELCQQNNLSRVHGEVFRYVEDGVEEFDVVALDFAMLQELRGVESAQGGFDFG